MKDAYDLGATKSLSGYDIRNAFTTSADYQLPFGKGMKGWKAGLVSGWEMTGILNLQGGLPVTLSASSPASLSGLNPGGRSPNATGCSYGQIVPGIQFVSGTGAVQYFNTSCFSTTSLTPLELGNVDVNSVIGPGLISVNYALARNFTLTERMHMQFRAEAFNLTNRVNFGEPVGSLSSATAGQLNSIVPSAPGRQIQFGAKLIF